MTMIIDIHTHHAAPQPEGIISVSAEEFNPIAGQLYSVGVHPWAIAGGISDTALGQLSATAAHPQVAAIGECGIDTLKGGPLFRQMQIFRQHVEVSESVCKPLVIHCVKAHDIIVGMKKDLNPSQPWLLHGFRGKPSVAKILTDAGIMISFGEKFNPDTLMSVPEDFILAETDDSSLTIEEILSRLNDTAGHTLNEIIIENTSRFLSIH